MKASQGMSYYLGNDAIIQTQDPTIQRLASALRATDPLDAHFARSAFEWVRDRIAHSYDVQDPRVTVTASEVLEEKVGLCYSKSHLLAALLRAGGIPAGLCYQRIQLHDGKFVLHGLVAVHLNGAWHRQDARGNRPGIQAEFSLGRESLACAIDPQRGEIDYPEIFATPAPVVISMLRKARDILIEPLPGEL